MDETLLSRVEDAGLNASAPPQQRWLDGWLLRFSPGKARRARCINCVATGRLPLDQKLALAGDVFDEAGLPMVVRITPFSQPPSLDKDLAERGYESVDDSRVMVNASLRAAPAPRAVPAGLAWEKRRPTDFAEAVGALRGSPQAQREAHAQRLLLSPVPYQGYVLHDEAGSVQACGQYAREAELVGLYDVFTHPQARGQGLAALLCERLLSHAVNEGATVGYLQVEGDNHVARRIYQRLGFVDAYSYHYRQRPPG